MTRRRSQTHVTFIRPNECNAEASAPSLKLLKVEASMTCEPSATFSHLQLTLHLPSPLQVWRPEGSEGGRLKEARKPRRTPKLDGQAAGRRASRRAEKAHTERRKRAPRVIDDFHTVVSTYVLERLLAGLEPTEDGIRTVQGRMWLKLEPKEQEKISIAGLEHPKTETAVRSAIEVYLTKCRIRDSRRKRSP